MSTLSPVGVLCPACGEPFTLATEASGLPTDYGTIAVCARCAAPCICLDPPTFTTLTPKMLTVVETTRPEVYAAVLAMQGRARQRPPG